jgi:hypothetical protein
VFEGHGRGKERREESTVCAFARPLKAKRVLSKSDRQGTKEKT